MKSHDNRIYELPCVLYSSEATVCSFVNGNCMVITANVVQKSPKSICGYFFLLTRRNVFLKQPKQSFEFFFFFRNSVLLFSVSFALWINYVAAHTKREQVMPTWVAYSGPGDAFRPVAAM